MNRTKAHGNIHTHTDTHTYVYIHTQYHPLANVHQRVHTQALVERELGRSRALLQRVCGSGPDARRPARLDQPEDHQDAHGELRPHNHQPDPGPHFCVLENILSFFFLGVRQLPTICSLVAMWFVGMHKCCFLVENVLLVSKVFVFICRSVFACAYAYKNTRVLLYMYACADAHTQIYVCEGSLCPHSRHAHTHVSERHAGKHG
jgi:hypothetical protein